jgi:hypothetical protein
MNIDFFVLGILHGVRGESPDDVSGAAMGPESSSGNLPPTPKINNYRCKCNIEV